MKRLITVAAVLLALPLAAQVPQADALFEQGRFEEAKKMLLPLKNDPEALIVLGKIAIRQNDSETAEKYLVRAVELKPNSAQAHFQLGNAYGDQATKASMFKAPGLASKTKAEFEKAVQLDPNYTDARLGLIDYYVMAPGFMGGSEEKALQQAAEVKKRDGYEGHRAYARVYTRQKKNDLARKEWIDAVREQPQSAKAHAALGTFYGLYDKNFKASFEELETALKLDPKYVVTRFRIGQVAASSGANLARGEQELKAYLTHAPGENEPDLGWAHYYLGMVYEKMGKKAEAKASYAAAVKMNPVSKTFNEALKKLGA